MVFSILGTVNQGCKTYAKVIFKLDFGNLDKL